MPTRVQLRPMPPRDLRDVHLANAKIAQQKFIQKDTCWSPGSGSNSDGAVTIQGFIPIGVDGLGDILVRFPKPLKRVMLASLGIEQTLEGYGFYIHFNPIGKTYPPGGPPPDGTENWIQLHDLTATTIIYIQGTIIEFSQPIDQFYVDLVGAGNQAFAFTFKDATDFHVQWRPQANTAG
jgi:hypothetical protein